MMQEDSGAHVSVDDLREAWPVLRREVVAGLCLGCVLAAFGLARVLLGHGLFGSYGPHHLAVGVAVAASLLAVVAWGAISGSMLPLLLQRAGLDPASASAPFVATLVDVCGVAIYFNVAEVALRGTLL